MTKQNNNQLAFFNGKYMPITEVAISPFDRGFLFGDSLYEVIPVYNGKMLGGDLHLQRLLNGLTAIGITSPYTLSDWRAISRTVLTTREAAQMLYIQVTRGVEASRKHRFPVVSEPTVLIFATPFTPTVTMEYQGCAATLQPDKRWQNCHIKATSLLANVLAYQQLYCNDLAENEALFVRDGVVVEAASSNLFMVKDNLIYTPPVDNILSGITRHIILQIAEKLKYQVYELAPSPAMLKNADEVWVSNSIEELKPVISIDGQIIGSGVPGKVWQELFQHYQHKKG
ncbi:aminotransferase class IV [Photobacterium kishitanii]|uniref:Aminodeoxychorismate lyase n=1 Tax=Photobacterium kishitanii TaxID=318456 RepID=A0A2T3KIF9_9GAMM|nr:aminotransferase class IV [Photobacterium kishitanii]PSU98953.1 D-alanine aminotransferase [Photobacterium kishitanii]